MDRIIKTVCCIHTYEYFVLSSDVDGIDSDDTLSDNEPIEVEIEVHENIDDESSDDQAADQDFIDDGGNLAAANVRPNDDERNFHAANDNMIEDESDVIMVDYEQRQEPNNDGNYN